jgi:hypothetical protein
MHVEVVCCGEFLFGIYHQPHYHLLHEEEVEDSYAMKIEHSLIALEQQSASRVISFTADSQHEAI